MRRWIPESRTARMAVAIVAGAALAGAIAASFVLVSPSGFPRRPAAQKLLQLDKPVVLDEPAH
jgi:hypothetical protein